MARLREKWLLAVNTLLVVGVFVAAFICNYVIYAPKIPVSGQQIVRTDTPLRNYDVRYPAFHIGPIDESLRSYAWQLTDAFLKEPGDRNNPHAKLTVNYALLHDGQQTASVRFAVTEQPAGKSPVTSYKMMTFDLRSQKQLALSDLFKNQTDASRFIGMLLHDYFQHDSRQRFTPGELAELLQLRLGDVRSFTLGETSVTLSLDPHHLAQPEHMTTVSIKKSRLSPILKDEYARDDQNAAGVTAATSAYTITKMPRHEALIDPKRKMLALTFDDGPGAYTSQLLAALRKHHAHATFFMIGRQVPGYANVVRQAVADGNDVGDHTWDHPDLTRLSVKAMRSQLQRTQKAIEKATGGYIPSLFRPPYEALDTKVQKYIKSLNLETVLWNVDTNDWLDRDSNIIYNRIMSQAGDGRVILMHDIYATSVDAAARAIPQLEKRGYQLVTISQLQEYR